jgi:predicted nucleic acid-binding Zn ribbon protein
MEDKMNKRDLALDLFKAFKNTAVKKANKTNSLHSSVPSTQTGKAGDPELISGVLSNLISDREWDSGLAEGNLFVHWKKIVGEEIAQHATPISILDGTLTIQSSSTSWATQLQLMSNDLLTMIQKDATGVLIEKIIFIGPHGHYGPSWKKGIRTIRNARGPRDTYG